MPDRGLHIHTPSLTTRADEAYVDFLSDARNLLMHAHGKEAGERANDAMHAREQELGRKLQDPDEVRDAVCANRDVATYLRVKRSLQEAKWSRVEDSYERRGEEFRKTFADSPAKAAGSLRIDPDFVVPDYASVEIHLQPGGYVSHDLAGLVYDYGNKVFFGSMHMGDTLWDAMAGRTSLPQDEAANKVLEIGCSHGPMVTALKRRLPDSEIWGIDIGAPMVRYAHWRAEQMGLPVHFAQMAAEDMDFEDGSFDLVVAHLLFHEVPQPVGDRIIAEAFRVLRPGGSFVVWDFAANAFTGGTSISAMGWMDGVDNCEPYAPAFMTSNLEQRLEAAGFTLRSHDKADILAKGRVADKPTS